MTWARDEATSVVVDGAVHHLGSTNEPEREDFSSLPREVRRLEVSIEARSNTSEGTLWMLQRGVKMRWEVRLNGKALGSLFVIDQPMWLALRVPAGALRDGKNTLRIEPPRGIDDIELGKVRLESRPLAEALGGSSLEVNVVEAASQHELPCRITITDSQGALVPVQPEPDQKLAVRTGVVYTGNGKARLKLTPGRHRVFASRGFEYGKAETVVDLSAGATARVDLALRREVDTSGLVACDTHVHSLTLSGHGDATLDERMITLAGEGVELPVSTEHNRLTDYLPDAERLGVRSYFTPVVGDEVTTDIGHFNAFPFPLSASAPAHRLPDWKSIIEGIRLAPGTRVIVLNHPCDVHSDFTPFAPENFNTASGELTRFGPATFDAMEVVNSGALRSDLMEPVRDWFALWSHGQQITAVGASDSHDVSRYTVGQARTYLRGRDDDPAHIEIASACESLRQGKALLCFGLLADTQVDGKYSAGELAPGSDEEMDVAVRVLGPSWSDADRVELYWNGIKLRTHQLEGNHQPGLKAEVRWRLPRPKYDGYLVAIASGAGEVGPFWSIMPPYQATSRFWKPRVLGISNPVRIDGDGDGHWTSPLGVARKLVDAAGRDFAGLFDTLAKADEAVATQAASLLDHQGEDLKSSRFARLIEHSAEPVRRGFTAYLQASEHHRATKVK